MSSARHIALSGTVALLGLVVPLASFDAATVAVPDAFSEPIATMERAPAEPDHQPASTEAWEEASLDVVGSGKISAATAARTIIRITVAELGEIGSPPSSLPCRHRVLLVAPKTSPPLGA